LWSQSPSSSPSRLFLFTVGCRKPSSSTFLFTSEEQEFTIASHSCSASLVVAPSLACTDAGIGSCLERWIFVSSSSQVKDSSDRSSLPVVLLVRDAESCRICIGVMFRVHHMVDGERKHLRHSTSSKLLPFVTAERPGETVRLGFFLFKQAAVTKSSNGTFRNSLDCKTGGTSGSDRWGLLV
jgi:hypothetical protein